LKNLLVKRFDIELEKQLDKIFGEDPESKTRRSKSEKKLLLYPNYNLKKIVFSMERGITDGLINKYLEQLNHLKAIFKKDRHIFILLKLQIGLGKHIQGCQTDAHPFAFKMVLSTFNSMNKILSSTDLKKTHKQLIVNRELKRYYWLKKNIKERRGENQGKEKTKIIMQDKTPKHINPSSDINAVGHICKADNLITHLTNLETNLHELKTLIKRHLEKLNFHIQKQYK
jgi:hypothetical protein